MRRADCSPGLFPRRHLVRGLLFLGLLFAGPLPAAMPTLVVPENRLTPEAPEWQELAGRFALRGDATADFAETRFFPFRKEPVALRGEVRVSAARGLSLHYTEPPARTVIIDAMGMLIRDAAGRDSAPADPRANAANEALLHVLRFDFGRLAEGFELYGRRQGEAWSLALVPKDNGVRRAIGDILVDGEGDSVRRIELRRSARQRIDIEIRPPRPAAAFTAEEEKRFFR
jgi:hypothetical protein